MSNSTDIIHPLDQIVEAMPSAEILEIEAAWRIHGSVTGPHLLVLGAVHGNEPAGFHAIEALLTQLRDRKLSLLSGTLTLAVGNPRALAARSCDTGHNLND